MKCYLQKKKMRVHKFTRDDILDACYGDESVDGNLIPIHEGSMKLDEDVLEDPAFKEFISKVGDYVYIGILRD